MPVEVGPLPYRKPVTPSVARLFPPFESKTSSGIFESTFPVPPAGKVFEESHDPSTLTTTLAHDNTGVFTWQA